MYKNNKVHFTIKTLRRIQREMIETAYEYLNEEDKNILKAFDSGEYIIDDVE